MSSESTNTSKHYGTVSTKCWHAAQRKVKLTLAPGGRLEKTTFPQAGITQKLLVTQTNSKSKMESRNHLTQDTR
jgi:hypothetical protein